MIWLSYALNDFKVFSKISICGLAIVKKLNQASFTLVVTVFLISSTSIFCNNSPNFPSDDLKLFKVSSINESNSSNVASNKHLSKSESFSE